MHLMDIKRRVKMTVSELIKELQKIPKSLHDEDINIHIKNVDLDDNVWLSNIQFNHCDSSGYELHNEVMLIGE